MDVRRLFAGGVLGGGDGKRVHEPRTGLVCRLVLDRMLAACGVHYAVVAVSVFLSFYSAVLKVFVPKQVNHHKEGRRATCVFLSDGGWFVV